MVDWIFILILQNNVEVYIVFIMIVPSRYKSHVEYNMGNNFKYLKDRFNSLFSRFVQNMDYFKLSIKNKCVYT